MNREEIQYIIYGSKDTVSFTTFFDIKFDGLTINYNNKIYSKKYKFYANLIDYLDDLIDCLEFFMDDRIEEILINLGLRIM